LGGEKKTRNAARGESPLWCRVHRGKENGGECWEVNILLKLGAGGAKFQWGRGGKSIFKPRRYWGGGGTRGVPGGSVRTALQTQNNRWKKTFLNGRGKTPGMESKGQGLVVEGETRKLKKPLRDW